MKKSIISVLFIFVVCALSANVVFAQVPGIKMCIMTLALDFGKVPVGTTKSLSFEIDNISNIVDPLLLISWSPVNQPFSIIPVGAFGLSPLTSRYFGITFKPTAVISYNQTISLSNNAFAIRDRSTMHEINGSPQLHISFSGNGVTTNHEAINRGPQLHISSDGNAAKGIDGKVIKKEK